MLSVRLALALGLFTAACSAPRPDPAPAASAAGPRLTLQAAFDLAPKLRLPPGMHLGWLPDGKEYLTGKKVAGTDRQTLFAVDAETGNERRFFDPARMERALAALPGVEKEKAEGWSRRTNYDYATAKDAILLNEANDLFVWRVGADEAARLTEDAAEEEGASFSPDGKLVAFVRDHDLFVVPADGGETRALVEEGDADHLVGRLDWLYQEEVYGRGNFQGYWWSPDSRRIAYLLLDQTGVPTYTIVDDREAHPKVETMRYPKAGDPNPKASLAVVDAAGGASRLFDLSNYATEDLLIVRVGWSPDSTEVFFQVQNRIQTWLDLLAGDPETGKVRRLFRDATAAWIEPTDAPIWVGDGSRFLWLSERDGYRHLYLYERDGTLARRLTEGRWEVDDVHGIDDATGTVFFSTDKDGWTGSQLYRVGLDGKGLAAITKSPGSHAISLAPGRRHFVDTYSSRTDPGRLELRRIDGSLVRELAAVDPARATELGWSTPEFVKVPTRDGFEMEATLIKPPGFDPRKRYPVLCPVYAGPHSPSVRDAFGGFGSAYHQSLAQEGILIFACDNRSASGKGLVSAAGIHRNLGEQELRDLEDGLDWLVAQGFADPARIGIWGWSYGGYMAAYALTHSKRFKVGIAGAPVTDWRLYDTIYTERYMDTPQANPEGYDRSSVLKAAPNLSGRLLLIHGAIDENVHPQNTLQLARALQQAGKRFDLMVYPGNRHGVVEPRQRRHLHETMARFLRENL